MYRILQRSIKPCRIKRRIISKDERWLVGILEDMNGKEFCTVNFNKDDREWLNNEIQQRKEHFIDECRVQLTYDAYHIISWDDVHLGYHNRKNVGEIERDKDGNPQIYRELTLYAFFDKQFYPAEERDSAEPTIYNRLKYYPNVKYSQHLLAYNNEAEYRKRVKMSQSRADIEDDTFDHEKDYDDPYETEENKIMDALESGEPELWGF